MAEQQNGPINKPDLEDEWRGPSTWSVLGALMALGAWLKERTRRLADPVKHEPSRDLGQGLTVITGNPGRAAAEFHDQHGHLPPERPRPALRRVK